MKQKLIRYCEHCCEETEHEEEVIRDASIPPEGLDEGYCSQEAAIFYFNGDSVYEVTCLKCWRSYEEV